MQQTQSVFSGYLLIILITLVQLGSTVIVINRQPPFQNGDFPQQQPSFGQGQYPQSPMQPGLNSTKGNNTQRGLPRPPQPPRYPQRPGYPGMPGSGMGGGQFGNPSGQNVRVDFVPFGALLMSAASG